MIFRYSELLSLKNPDQIMLYSQRVIWVTYEKFYLLFWCPSISNDAFLLSPLGNWPVSFLAPKSSNDNQQTDYPQDCPPQNCPLGGNPEVGNSESISHQDCPPRLLCFFTNCLCSIWALGECWGLRQCIQSQYFEEQSNSCDYWRHLKTHSGEKSNKCAQWDIAGHWLYSFDLSPLCVFK